MGTQRTASERYKPFWGVLGVTESKQSLRNDMEHFAMSLLLKDLMKNVVHWNIFTERMNNWHA